MGMNRGNPDNWGWIFQETKHLALNFCVHFKFSLILAGYPTNITCSKSTTETLEKGVKYVQSKQ